MVVNALLGKVINGLYAIINGSISLLASILPNFSIADTVSGAMAALSPYLSAVNYFIPISQMASIALAWVTAVLLWYVVQFVLRFIQLGS